MMKLLVMLSLSLCIAAVACAILVSFGYIKIERGMTVENINDVPELAVKMAGDMQNDASGNLHQRNSAMPNFKSTAQPDPDSAEDTPIQNQNPSYFDLAQDFLDRLVPGQAENIEFEFTQFLKEDLKLDKADIERMVRMCFWKNFVTLQISWHARDLERMSRMFENEMRLKNAGFAASGLSLVSSDLKDAEDQFLALKNLLSQSADDKTE